MSKMYMYAAEDMKKALQSATADGACVVYWFDETKEQWGHLTYLTDEDGAAAQAMYGRIKKSGVDVIKGASFECEGTTYFPMLVAAGDVNPAHFLLAHKATLATPYYFLKEQRRDDVLAFVLGTPVVVTPDGAGSPTTEAAPAPETPGGSAAALVHEKCKDHACKDGSGVEEVENPAKRTKVT